MFETAELGRKVSKRSYEAMVPGLRTELLRLQREIMAAEVPVYLLIHGLDGSGRGDVLNLLHEWLDARYLSMFALGEPTEEERQHPPAWRYWMSAPSRGRIGVYFGSWYSEPMRRRVHGKSGDAELDAAMIRVTAFEKALIDDGALIIKLWLHIPRSEQKRRFKKIEQDPDARWPVTKQDWKHFELYDEFRAVASRVLRLTSTADAPWTVIEAGDARHRDVTVAEQLVERLRGHAAGLLPRGSGGAAEGEGVSEPAAEAAPAAAPGSTGSGASGGEALTLPRVEVKGPTSILDTLDLSLSLDKAEYEARLVKGQARLNRLMRKMSRKSVAATLVFQGWDAAGKGGAIRRIAHALDARDYRIIPIAAPTEEERAHHYLWRFWRHLPRLGHTAIFDRSWYGRVLVERVEGFATEPEWQRAYGEINDFEEQLTESGIVVIKYWLHISPDEQLRRFQEREQKPWKRHKITPEDYRNREKWPAYERAVGEMIERTSTEFAPWTLVEGNDKRYARVKALETFVRRLEDAL